MELAQIVAGNLQRICKEHDLSSNELANRSGMPQKTIYTMIQGTHQCRIDNLDKIAKALLVSPTSLVTPHLPTSVLMSRKRPDWSINTPSCPWRTVSVLRLISTP